MSTCFENRKAGDKSFAPKTSPAASFDLSNEERTWNITSNSEKSDDPCTSNDSGYSTNIRDKKNVRKMMDNELEIRIDHINSEETDASDENLKFSSIKQLTINSTEDELVPKIEELTLDTDDESTINKIAQLNLNDDHKPLAGVVTSVAKAIGLIVVKATMPQDVLLYLGSPVFIEKSNATSALRYVKLGWIIDVLGPACEPYYCVKPINDGIEQIHEGTRVFYSPDHSRTAFLRLKRGDGNRYTVIYSPRTSFDNYNREGQMGEKDFWNNVSRSNVPQHQVYRRRWRGYNRETYRRQYKNNLFSFYSIQPKHSYFDY